MSDLGAVIGLNGEAALRLAWSWSILQVVAAAGVFILMRWMWVRAECLIGSGTAADEPQDCARNDDHAQSANTEQQHKQLRSCVLGIMIMTTVGVNANAASFVPIAHAISDQAGQRLVVSGLVIGMHHLGSFLGLFAFRAFATSSTRGGLFLHIALMIAGSLLCIIGQSVTSSVLLVILGRLVTGMDFGVSLLTSVSIVNLSESEDRPRNMLTNTIAGQVGRTLGFWLCILTPARGSDYVIVPVAFVVYACILFVVVILCVPDQNVIHKLRRAGSVNAQSGMSEPPSDMATFLTVSASLALATMDSMMFRCNTANLVLVLTVGYGATEQAGAKILGATNLLGIFVLILLTRLQGTLNSFPGRRMISTTNAMQIAMFLPLFRTQHIFPVIDSPVWVAILFQASGAVQSFKGSSLKTCMTQKSIIKPADILTASGLCGQLCGLLGPVVGRFVSEVQVSQNLIPWFGIVAVILQIAVWELAHCEGLRSFWSSRVSTSHSRLPGCSPAESTSSSDDDY